MYKEDLIDFDNGLYFISVIGNRCVADDRGRNVDWPIMDNEFVMEHNRQQHSTIIIIILVAIVIFI